jgi:hypothetical protein
MKGEMRLPLLATAVVLLSAAASADTIIQSQSFPGAGAGNDVSNTDYQLTTWSQTYAFSTFDTTLGTLNSISITIADGLTGFVTVTNTSGAPATFKAAIEDLSDFSLTPDPDSTNNFFEDDFFDSLQKVNNGASIASGAFGTTPVRTISATTGPQDASSFFGLAYTSFETTGDGTIDLYESVPSRALVQGTSFSDSATTGAQSTVTIVYDYTPNSVPEPVSMSLVGSGLVICALTLRKARIGTITATRWSRN